MASTTVNSKTAIEMLFLSIGLGHPAVTYCPVVPKKETKMNWK